MKGIFWLFVIGISPANWTSTMSNRLTSLPLNLAVIECSSPNHMAWFIRMESCCCLWMVKELLHGAIYILVRIRVFTAMDDFSVIGAKRQIRMYLRTIHFYA